MVEFAISIFKLFCESLTNTLDLWSKMYGSQFLDHLCLFTVSFSCENLVTLSIYMALFCSLVSVEMLIKHTAFYRVFLRKKKI